MCTAGAGSLLCGVWQVYVCRGVYNYLYLIPGVYIQYMYMYMYLWLLGEWSFFA